MYVFLIVLVGYAVGMYFMVYPIIYFAYNYAAVGFGYPQYQIPDFWIGMAGFFLLDVLRRFLHGR